MTPIVGTSTYEVETPEGPGRWHLDLAESPSAVLALGHGAGGGVTAMDLALLAAVLPAHRISVARFEQPWRLAGRKVATPPPRLDIAWLAAVDDLRMSPGLTGLPLVVGGRSAGARVACRTANTVDAAGTLCLAFPLHLPGRPEKSRLSELLTPTVPRLVLQGTRDSFGSADELTTALSTAGAADATGAAKEGVEVVPVPGADHSFKTLARAEFRPADVRSLILESVLRLLETATSGLSTDEGSPAGTRPD